MDKQQGKDKKRNNSMAFYGLDSIMSMASAGGLGGKQLFIMITRIN